LIVNDKFNSTNGRQTTKYIQTTSLTATTRLYVNTLNVSKNNRLHLQRLFQEKSGVLYQIHLEISHSGGGAISLVCIL